MKQIKTIMAEITVTDGILAFLYDKKKGVPLKQLWGTVI